MLLNALKLGTYLKLCACHVLEGETRHGRDRDWGRFGHVFQKGEVTLARPHRWLRKTFKRQLAGLRAETAQNFICTVSPPDHQLGCCRDLSSAENYDLFTKCPEVGSASWPSGFVVFEKKLEGAAALGGWSPTPG